jgi:hypothetical protein
MIMLAIYAALAFSFFVIATGLSAILRAFLPPRLQAALMALLVAGVWAPVRWWGAEPDAEGWLDGWHPLVGNWLLGEPANRPELTMVSLGVTAMLAYWAIRWWATRRHLPVDRPPDVTLH